MPTKSNRVLILRSCNLDGISRNDFKWPLEVGAEVSCPDFEATKECGNGLHGLLWGAGDSGLVPQGEGKVGLVVSALESEVVDLGGKVKFPRCRIEFVGTLQAAASWLATETGRVVHFAVVSGVKSAVVGDYGTATAGNYGTTTAGNYGTATAGDGGKATAGDCGTATAGDGGTATAGYGGKAAAGNCGKATAGYGGKATAGNCGTATAGDGGTATAGYGGKAAAGNCGHATAGNCGHATAGYYGILTISWFDGKRTRISTAYVREGGILANTAYKLDSEGKFVVA
jgi:hypothetical protein